MKKSTLEKLKKKYAEVKKRSEGGPFWVPDTGDNKIRILPGVGKMGDEFYVEGGIHFNVGPDSSVVVCPEMTSGETCPVCELVKSLFESGTKSDLKLAKAMKPKARFWMNILDVGDKGSSPQVFGAGIQIFKEVLSFFTDPDYGDLTDLVEGRDITLTRSGSGIETEYSVRPRPKPSKIKAKLAKKALDLSKWEHITPPGEDEIIELLGVSEEDEDDEDVDDTEDDDTEDEDDDDTEDDDEDEDDEDDDSDDDEDEDDDEDDSDEDEDEDDEDEDDEEKKPPKRKSRSKKKTPPKRSSKAKPKKGRGRK